MSDPAASNKAGRMLMQSEVLFLTLVMLRTQQQTRYGCMYSHTPMCINDCMLESLKVITNVTWLLPGCYLASTCFCIACYRHHAEVGLLRVSSVVWS